MRSKDREIIRRIKAGKEYITAAVKEMVDNNIFDVQLLDATISYAIKRGKEVNTNCNLTCWLIQAKQYRNLEAEGL